MRGSGEVLEANFYEPSGNGQICHVNPRGILHLVIALILRLSHMVGVWHLQRVVYIEERALLVI